MKLTAISVENYRSITKAYKVRLGDTTVLVGPNNEGKSNVLLALVTAMNILTEEQFVIRLREGPARIRMRPRHERVYDWRRDFPIHLQSANPKGQSVIVLELGLTDTELEDFRRSIQSDLSGSLPIKIAIGPTEDVTVSVYKKGPGAKALSKKSARIAEFVSRRLRLEHIPAVRTAHSAERVVEGLVGRELKRLETDPEYQQAVAQIAALQEPILKSLSDNIKKTLVQFLPDVKAVDISVPREDRYRALRQSVSIVVNDGTPTELQYKGDGVQSLAALGIMRHASELEAASKHSVIAIEEPESHLHPGAIHELRKVLAEMNSKHQIVLTTHNPLFIDRVNISSNIIVVDNKARPARTIQELRDTLGVRASDNLRSAALVLLVEGEDDRMALAALIRAASQSLSDALQTGTLALESLRGAGNLSYRLTQLRDALCNAYCFLDDDPAARGAVDKAREFGLITLGDITLATCPGRQEAELEDLYDPSVYASGLQTKYGVSLSGPKFRNAKKWSVRMRETFKQHGKPWTDKIEAEVKDMVAAAVAKAPQSALTPATRSCVDALLAVLQTRVAAIRHPVRRRPPNKPLKLTGAAAPAA